MINSVELGQLYTIDHAQIGALPSNCNFLRNKGPHLVTDDKVIFVLVSQNMEESVYKSEWKKIKIKKRQMSTKLEGYMGEDVSLLDTAMFDSHLKSLDTICHNVTDSIHELTIDLEDEDEEDSRISDLDQMKTEILKTLHESKAKLISNKSKKPGREKKC